MKLSSNTTLEEDSGKRQTIIALDGAVISRVSSITESCYYTQRQSHTFSWTQSSIILNDVLKILKYSHYISLYKYVLYIFGLQTWSKSLLKK